MSRRESRQNHTAATIRNGPPTKASSITYEVVVGNRVLVRFGAFERNNAVDFANGYNAGVRATEPRRRRFFRVR